MGRTALVLLISLAPCAFAQSKAWQDTIALPTWVEGSPDIHPKLDALDPEHSFYPYPSRLNFTNSTEPELWRRLNLENEYLACSFLPDLGGHIYTCTDKRNGRPLFRGNPSIKKADIGPRGAWIATGVEFNFPVAHSRYTVSPVDFGIRQENGRAQVWLADTDLVTGMRWLAEFTLRDGSAALEQRVTLSNPSAARHPYLWWANAGIELDAGTRFVYPTHVMSSPGLADLFPWPLDGNGIDWSKPITLPASTALFAYGSREPFMAVYNTATRTAAVHVADPAVVTGKKLYHWGTVNYRWVRQHLSDDNSLYVEMQAGLFANQETFEFLEPGEEVNFTELWMAGRDLNGVSRANENAILSLERVPPDNALVTQLNVTHAIPGARLALFDGAKPVWEDKADLSPARTYEHALPNPSKPAYRFELRDSSGKLLLAHTEGLYEAVTAESVKLGPQPSQAPSGKRDSAADCLALGQYNERKSLYHFAENDYRAGLAKWPDDLQLNKSLGRLLAAENRYAEAAPLLTKASQKLALDPELHYYLGLSLAFTGKEDDARKSWAIAEPDREFGPPSLMQEAALESRAGRSAEALALAEKAIDRRPSLLPARKLEIALLRNSNSLAAARKQCDAALALDPVDSFLRLESVKLGGKDDALWPHLSADPQRVLELADTYVNFGMYDDAFELLARQYQAVPTNQTEPGAALPQANALVSYYRAYVESKLGRDASADFKLASSQRLEYIFPHRGTAEAALEAALKADPKDASALLLTGLLDLDRNRAPDAANEFQAALAIRKDLPAIHYLFGRTLLLLPDHKSEAEAVMREGVAANPGDKELKAALDAALRPPAPAKTADTAAATAAAATAAAGAPPPTKAPQSSVDFAMKALSDAAEGKAQITEFSARDFPEPKQPPEVRQAYVEVQLQAMRARAAHKECVTALTDLDHIGAANPGVPFTLEGFDAFTGGARFQYYIGAVEDLCGRSKEAKRTWSKVAKMAPAVDSPDFAFPAIARQNLTGSAKNAEIDELLKKVNGAFEQSPQAKSVLSYSRGILLLAKSDERGAVAAFTRGANSARRDFGWYLNREALVEASHAGPRH